MEDASPGEILMRASGQSVNGPSDAHPDVPPEATSFLVGLMKKPCQRA